MTPLDAIPILPTVRTHVRASCLATNRSDRVSAVTKDDVMGEQAEFRAARKAIERPSEVFDCSNGVARFWLNCLLTRQLTLLSVLESTTRGVPIGSAIKTVGTPPISDSDPRTASSRLGLRRGRENGPPKGAVFASTFTTHYHR